MAGSKTWMPTVAGIFMLIAGGLGALRGLGQLIGGLFAEGFFRFIGFEMVGWLSIALAIVIFIAGLVTLSRKMWWLALIGAILASIHFWLFGILAIIFIALSKKEFA